MSKRGLFLLCGSLLVIFQSSVNAQGLKGVPGGGEIHGREAYIEGSSDAERWKTFLMVEPKLLGMTRQQVKNSLGEPNTGHDTFEYGITKAPVATKPRAWAYLTVFFRNGQVWKFAVQAKD
jgi:hypothetical protein